MDALEFIRERNRMCNSFDHIGCGNCPANKHGECIITLWDEEIVPIVEKWSKEHPRKTRQDVFLEQWPEAKVNEDGVLLLCPAIVSSAHRNPYGNCGSLSELCDDCYREFWMQEVDNG
jgi:hypothetical protein